MNRQTSERSQIDSDPALDVHGMCRELGGCRATIYRLYISTGMLPTFKVGTARRARLSAVRELKSRLEAEATSK